MGNSPAPSSPPEDRGGLGGGQAGNGRVTSGKQRPGTTGFLPLSDSNVSTTHQDAAVAVANWNNDDLNVSFDVRS
jgi:hypothetical protein